MSGYPAWPLVRLEEITTKIGSGATPRGGQGSYKSEGISLIRSLNVYDFEFSYQDLAHIDDNQAQQLANVEVQAHDILLNITGASVARCCMVPAEILPARVNQHVSIVRVNPQYAVPHYILYCVNSPQYKNHLLALAQGGATREALTKSTIENFLVPLPPLPIQRRIAAVLSAYDDLIEVNQQRIEALEAAAQALYRECFVEMRFPGYESAEWVESELGVIPAGWAVCRLGDVTENFDRKRIPLSSRKRQQMQGQYPYYGAAKLLDHVNDYIFDGRYLLFAEDGSVTNEDGTPVLQLVEGKFWANNHTHVLQGIEPVSTNYLYVAMSNTHISGYLTGTAQPKLNQTNLNRIPVLVPAKRLLDKLNPILDDIFAQVNVLGRRNDVLRETRDLLLPRLVSGEVSVEGLPLPEN